MAEINKNQLSELLNGDINEFIKKNLSKDQQDKLSALINDKKATNDLLSSEQAKDVLKNFFNQKD